MAAVPLTKYAVHLRPLDNIAVAARLVPGDVQLTHNGGTFTVPATIKMGHKFAVVPIKEGDAILKYGQIIGFAGKNIAVGEHVHVHTGRPLPRPADAQPRRAILGAVVGRVVEGGALRSQ